MLCMREALGPIPRTARWGPDHPQNQNSILFSYVKRYIQRSEMMWKSTLLKYISFFFFNFCCQSNLELNNGVYLTRSLKKKRIFKTFSKSNRMKVLLALTA